MFNELSANIRWWVREKLLRVPPGFFNGEGEHLLRFGGWWRGPLIGYPGARLNWVLAVCAIALLIFLWRSAASRALHGLRIGLAAGTVGLMALLVPVAAGLHWWAVVPIALAVNAAIIALYVQRFEVTVMVLGRVSLFALLLMVINGPVAWNITLASAAALLIIDVYRREGRSHGARITLGLLRAALVGLVLLLLNRPFFQHVTTEVKPSVVAVLIDDSESMSVHDVNTNALTAGDTRLKAAVNLFTERNRELIRSLAKVHTLHFYKFDHTATEIGGLAGPDEVASASDRHQSADSLEKSLAALEAKGSSTQVIQSLLAALKQRRSDRLAGIVLLTDARDTPTPAAQEAYNELAAYHVKVYPVAVGSDKRPKNITMQSADVRETAFKGDIVNVKAIVRATGYEPGHSVKVRLTDARTNAPLIGPDLVPVEKTITVADSNPVTVELLFKPDQIGELKINVEAVRQPGELYENDNSLVKEISILDAKITVLYVEGYPRWEYRYIKNLMIRDKSVNISCILTRADPTFAQEHTDLVARGENGKYKFFPYTQFPFTLEQLMECDVVLFGDVSPNEFTTPQLQMLSDFVSKKGGGFGMIAGERKWSPSPTDKTGGFSPADFRGTPIDFMLPITVVNVPPVPDSGKVPETNNDGFRPVLTRDGAESPIFRFNNDPTLNEEYIKHLQLQYWYMTGIVAKPGSTVLAEHPAASGPDGQKAPLLVVGRFGAGRTLFSAYDESWRWRFYTGESIFDTYWIEQLKYLARGKKLGERHLIFGPEQKVYQLGEQVRVNMHVLDSEVSGQLLDDLGVEVINTSTNEKRVFKMLSSKEQPDFFTVSFPADRAGSFIIKPLNAMIDRLIVHDSDKKMEVVVPDLEFAEPAVDKDALQALAVRTGGQPLSLEEARAKLPTLIESLQETRKLGGGLNDRMYMFSDMPLTLAVLMLLLTAEWVIRKVYGMV